MIYPQDFNNKIICGDCLEVMTKIPNESVDLVVTSPPYNLNIRKTFGNTQNWKAKWNKSKLQSQGYDQHEDYMPEDQYIIWQKKVLAECFRVIKNTGAIFYNHKWRVQKGLFQQRSEIIEGLPLRQIIIWKKAGGINFNEGYFLPTYEVIYLIAKPDFKLAPKVNRYGDVWEITQEKGSWHPAPFPVELASRCVEATTGSTILDPFMGSGSVAVACKKLNKNYIGIDLSQAYCLKAEQRIKDLLV
jgi:site-specific DNA-methyltransferase (adenine-specific)